MSSREIADKIADAARMQTNAGWSQAFVVRSSAGGPVVDLTGWTIEGEIQQQSNPSTKLDLSEGNGRLVITPATGSVTVNLSATDMATFSEGILEIEIRRIAPLPIAIMFRARQKCIQGIDD